jgi:hypothetical protein
VQVDVAVAAMGLIIWSSTHGRPDQRIQDEVDKLAQSVFDLRAARRATAAST